MLQPKDMDWLNGYKIKTHIYVTYKREVYSCTILPQETRKKKSNRKRQLYNISSSTEYLQAGSRTGQQQLV